MNQNPVFKNLKILDLSTVLAGPSVGSFFAELGAEVLKIENPNNRDITRSWKLPKENKDSLVSAYFSSVNYKKDYLALDLSQLEQRQSFLEKVSTADVVLMNFKNGDQEKLEITDEILQAVNPRLIIGKINGFGADSARLAYDLILQAETGIMSMNGTPESGPVKMPVAFIDVLAGHQLKEAILIELLNRQTTKNYKGRVLNVSLYDTAVSSLVNQASNYLMANYVPERMGSLHPNIAPYGEIFKTADHRLITFAVGSNRQFEDLCAFLNHPDVAEEERFVNVQNRVKNRSDLFEILAPLVKKYKADFILTQMEALKVPCGEIKNLAAVFETSRAQKLIREEIIKGEKTKRVSSIAFELN